MSYGALGDHKIPRKKFTGLKGDRNRILGTSAPFLKTGHSFYIMFFD
jgi:hypothetical protein